MKLDLVDVLIIFCLGFFVTLCVQQYNYCAGWDLETLQYIEACKPINIGLI